MNKILIGTNNLHKLEEIKAILGDFLEYHTLQEVQIHSEPEENGTTYEENAFIKAKYFSDLSGMPCLADDTGLEIDYLQGKPGIYSARWSGVSGEKRYQANNAKILEQLSNCVGEDRKARFVCVTVLAYKGKQLLCCRGECLGHILTQERGKNGFGYDPLFEVDGYNKTYAELENTIKNQISHRARSLQKFMQEFSNISL